MAPILVRSSPLGDSSGSPGLLGLSPRIFWALLVLVILALLSFLGYLLQKVYLYTHRSSQQKTLLPLYNAQTGRRLLLLPQLHALDGSDERLYTWHAQLQSGVEEKFKVRGVLIR
jgi:hypothetical protein